MARGMERIWGYGSDTVVINADFAAEDPVRILDAAGRYQASGRYPTPGHILRLLQRLDEVPPRADLRAIVVGGANIVL